MYTQSEYVWTEDAAEYELRQSRQQERRLGLDRAVILVQGEREQQAVRKREYRSERCVRGGRQEIVGKQELPIGRDYYLRRRRSIRCVHRGFRNPHQRSVSEYTENTVICRAWSACGVS